MEIKSFRVVGLSSCYHTEETKEIFRRRANGSITDLVTAAIVKYAQELGFNKAELNTIKYSINLGYHTLDGNSLAYITDDRMGEIDSLIDRSRGKDYTYLVAFEYLQWKRPGVSKSNLQRDAISNSC